MADRNMSKSSGTRGWTTAVRMPHIMLEFVDDGREHVEHPFDFGDIAYGIYIIVLRQCRRLCSKVGYCVGLLIPRSRVRAPSEAAVTFFGFRWSWIFT